MGFKTWDEHLGEMEPAKRARIDQLTEEAQADYIAHNLQELRRGRNVTQVELAERLDKSQPAISKLENATDNKLSTIRDVVEGLGGRLEVTAVFDDERIAIA